MSAQPAHDDSRNPLRPPQVAEMQEEKKRLEAALNPPPHMRNVAQLSDPREAARQLRAIERRLHSDAPAPYDGKQVDEAVKRERQLREEILQGMPSTREMRRNPPGAVDKHRTWEYRNKNKIQEWKKLRLRLHAGGHMGDLPADAKDVANVETIRPAGSGADLDTNGAQIEPTQYYMPPGQVESVILTDEEIRAIREVEPEIAKKLLLMDADQRRQAKEIARSLIEGQQQEAEAPKAKKSGGVADKRRKAAELNGEDEQSESDETDG